MSSHVCCITGVKGHAYELLVICQNVKPCLLQNHIRRLYQHKALQALQDVLALFLECMHVCAVHLTGDCTVAFEQGFVPLLTPH